MRLAQYFSTTYALDALTKYTEFVPATWSVGHKFELYTSAKIAFDSDTDIGRKRDAFRYIYESLRGGWQVFRPVSADQCWSSDKIFDVLTSECKPCARQSVLTLQNLVTSDTDYKITACLTSLGKLKPTTNYPAVYPWMAVSKFQHFYNPRLFPIYDRAYIWDKVANGAFKRDYEDFCSRKGFRPTENSARFNLQYILWASETIQGNSDECMPIFSQWFAAQVGNQSDSQGILQDVGQYYGSAFEMIAIGASQL